MDQLKDRELFRDKGLIDGAWVGAASGKTVDVDDPARQTVIGTVPDMGGSETRAAIEAAERAYPAWKRKTNAERAALLEAWHRLMLEHVEDLALILTTEQGKPLDEARGDGSRLPLTALVDQFYGDVQAMGGNRWDTSSLIKRL